MTNGEKLEAFSEAITALNAAMFENPSEKTEMTAIGVIDRLWKAGWRIHRKRQQHKVRAPRQSVEMTADIGAKIRRLHALEPNLPLDRIAVVYDVNPGRVSEALVGKW